MSGSLPCFSHISASRDVDYLGITLPIFLFRSIDPSVLSNLMTLIRQMVRAGVWLNAVSLVLIVLALYTLLPLVFGVSI